MARRQGKRNTWWRARSRSRRVGPAPPGLRPARRCRSFRYEPLESARRRAACSQGLGGDRRRRRRRRALPRRLRLRALAGKADRHPDHRRLPARQAKTPVTFDYADESDSRPVSDPSERPHRGRLRPARADRRPRPLPPVRAVRARAALRRWLARRLGRDLEPSLEPGCDRRGWTSADAAGLPILPGLARYDEVVRGRIDHALRFRSIARGARTSTRPATSRATTDPCCRRWAYASG